MLNLIYVSVLFDIIDRSLKGTAGESLIPSLYKGTQVNKIICLKCGRMLYFTCV